MTNETLALLVMVRAELEDRSPSHLDLQIVEDRMRAQGFERGLLDASDDEILKLATAMQSCVDGLNRFG